MKSLEEGINFFSPGLVSTSRFHKNATNEFDFFMIAELACMIGRQWTIIRGITKGTTHSSWQFYDF